MVARHHRLELRHSTFRWIGPPFPETKLPRAAKPRGTSSHPTTFPQLAHARTPAQVLHCHKPLQSGSAGSHDSLQLSTDVVEAAPAASRCGQTTGGWPSLDCFSFLRDDDRVVLIGGFLWTQPHFGIGGFHALIQKPPRFAGSVVATATLSYRQARHQTRKR